MPEPIPNSPTTASGFSEWIVQYNESGISKHSYPSAEISTYAKRCNAVFSSSLKRSIQSAELLSAECTLVVDPLFVEAGMPYAEWHFAKFAPKYWAVLFRILWYLGYSRNSESYRVARQRAVNAAHRLVEFAESHQSVLIVGHGIFNRLVAKELRALGWSGPRNPGSNYWGFGVFTY